MGNDYSTQCQLIEKVEMPAGMSLNQSPWTLYKALYVCDTSRVSVFVYDIKSTEKHNSMLMNCAENCAKYLSRLRHPNIVRIHKMESVSDHKWIVTEPVIPLTLVLHSLLPLEITSGLYNIIEALSFLHSQANVCHNNVCLESVFVSETGIWKLGAMDCACQFNDATPEFLKKFKPIRADISIAPGEENGVTIGTASGRARDAYGLLQLVEYVSEYLTSLGDAVKNFLGRIEGNCVSSSEQTACLSNLLEDEIFKNDFINILNFIKNLTIKSESEKVAFFKDMPRKLYELPVHLVGNRLTKMLLSRFVVLDASACEYFLPHFLTPCAGNVRPASITDDVINPIFPCSLYQRYVIPELFNIFHVRDAHVRKVLLLHFEHYAELFDRVTLTSVILPQLTLSVRDANDELVMLSLNALAVLVSLLGGDVVIGDDRRHIFSQGQPKGENVTPVQNGELPKRPSKQLLSPRTTRMRISNESAKGIESKKKVEDKRLIKVSNKQHPVPLPLAEKGSAHSANRLCAPENHIDDVDESYASDSSQANDSDTVPRKHVTFSTPLTTELSSPKRIVEPVVTLVEKESDSSFNEWSDWNIDSSTVESDQSSPKRIDSSTVESDQSSSKLSRPSDQKHSKLTSGNHHGLGKFNPNQPLGCEYDIMQLNLKMASPSKALEELDFFAGMTPEFKPANQESLLDVITNNGKSTTSRFNLSANDDLETPLSNANDWDVDFNWEHADQ